MKAGDGNAEDRGVRQVNPGDIKVLLVHSRVGITPRARPMKRGKINGVRGVSGVKLW